MPASVDAVKTGHVDGAFIDGNRNGFWSNPCYKGLSTEKGKQWSAGLNASHAKLAQSLGPNHNLISNYPTKAASAWCPGAMAERGLNLGDLMAWKNRKCGGGKPLTGGKVERCILEQHVQYADQSEAKFQHAIVEWVLGVSEYQYFGVGKGWSGSGPGACAAWLRDYPEYSKPLGKPKSDAQIMTIGNNKVHQREFATGTWAFLGQYMEAGVCEAIFWSDGSVTSPNASYCPKSPLKQEARLAKEEVLKEEVLGHCRRRVGWACRRRSSKVSAGSVADIVV